MLVFCEIACMGAKVKEFMCINKTSLCATAGVGDFIISLYDNSSLVYISCVALFLCRTALFAALVVINCAVSSAQELKIENEFVNFGDIYNGSARRSRTVVYQNIGDTELVIEKIRTGCACLGGKFNKTRLSPGEIGTFELAYEPEEQTGEINHLIYIVSNDKMNQVKAVSLKAKLSPVLEIDRTNIVFDVVSSEQPSNMVVVVNFKNVWSKLIDSIAIRSTSPYVEIAPAKNTGPMRPGESLFCRILLDCRLMPEKNHSALVTFMASAEGGKVVIMRKLNLFIKKTACSRYDPDEVQRNIQRGWDFAPAKIEFRDTEREKIVRLVSTAGAKIDWAHTRLSMPNAKIQLLHNGVEEDRMSGEYLIKLTQNLSASKVAFSVLSADIRISDSTIKKYFSVQFGPRLSY